MKVRNVVMVLTMVCGALTLLSAEDKASPGEDVFKSHCVVCHGADGTGSTTLGKQLKASDLHSAEVQKLSDAELKKIISDGKNNMPAFSGQITAAEIDDLVKYIRTMGKAKK